MTIRMETELELQEPVPTRWIKVRGMSRDFWRTLAIGSAALVLAFLLGWSWDTLSLPTFEFNGGEFQWIFPVTAALALFFAKSLMGAFQEDNERKRKEGAQLTLDQFEREAFPFLRREIDRVEGGLVGGFDIPPEDWLANMLILGLKTGEPKATWSTRYKDSEEFGDYVAILENDGRRVKFVAELPESASIS